VTGFRRLAPQPRRQPSLRRRYAVTPLSAAPRGLGFHPDPEYTRQITNVRWIVLHVIEETAAHSGHLEIARELLDGKTRLGGR
jgi:uncharacterized protein (DUF2461 family)